MKGSKVLLLNDDPCRVLRVLPFMFLIVIKKYFFIIKKMGNSLRGNGSDFSFGSYKSKKNPRPGYHKTVDGVFYRGKSVKADPSSFEKLGFSWGKDSSTVFYKG